jgi:hypothetical protein
MQRGLPMVRDYIYFYCSVFTINVSSNRLWFSYGRELILHKEILNCFPTSLHVSPSQKHSLARSVQEGWTS